MDSGAICGQSSWDLPNNAISARAGPFMCRMRADEEKTIMPESGEERRGCCIVPIPLGPVSSNPETLCCGDLAWLCGVDCGTHILSGKCSPDCARVAPMAGIQKARLSCEYRIQRHNENQVAYKDGVVVAEIEPAIFSEPACESGFPRIHIPRGVGSRESGDRRA